MRYKLLLIALLASICASAQGVFPLPSGSPNIFQQIPRTQFKLSLGVPLVADTSSALMGGLDSLGLVVQVRSTGVWWKRDTVSGGGHKWTQVGASTGSPGVWGSITGTLTDQGDLLAALNAKQNALSFTPIAPADTAAMLSTRPLLSYVQQNFYPLTGNPGGFLTNNGLSNLVNQLQVINSGGVDSYGAGLYSARPSAGTPRRFYFATDSLKIYYDNGSVWLTVAGGSGGGGSSVWGGITGTLSSQTDLNNALNLKLNKTDTATMLGPYYRTPLGPTSQYVRGNGSLATTDTSMIPSFSLKVRSEFSALVPALYANGVFNVDTTTGLTHLVTQNLLKNSIDTFKVPHKGLINLIYPGGSDTIVDKGLKNKGNVKFFTDPVDSAIWASTDTSAGGLATQTMLLVLNAANLTSGTIPTARFATASISPAAINATGFSGSGTKALLDNGTWGTISGGSGTTNLLVVQKANLDSIYSSSGQAGVLPLTTYLVAGAMDPAELKKIDSIANFANTRVGDSLAYSDAAHDSIYIKGVELTNGGNISIVKNHTQQKLSYAIGLSSSYAGQSSIVTVGTIAAGTWQGNPLLPTYGGVPTGGLANQILIKNTNTNYDYGWINSPYVPDSTTTLGDILYRGSATIKRLPGYTLTQRAFLTQIGTGSASTAPGWYVPLPGDVSNWLAYTPENVANKSNATLSTSTTAYPTDAAAKAYIDGSFAGSAGTGFMNFTNQGSNPATPSGGVDIFSRAANTFSIKGGNGAVNTFGVAGTTTNTFTFPDLGGSSDNVVMAATAQTLTNKTISTGSVIALGSDQTGDTYYRNSSGFLQRLSPGSNGQSYQMVSGIPGWVSQSATSDATYFPTFSSLVNVTSGNISSSEIFYYSVVGNVVTVRGDVQITPTAGSTTTSYKISLPIASTRSSGPGLFGFVSPNLTGVSLPYNNYITGVSGTGPTVTFTSPSSISGAIQLTVFFSYEIN